MLNKTLALSLVGILLLIGCAVKHVETPVVTQQTRCEYISETRLRIEGFINENLLTCVSEGRPDLVTTIIVDTPGGNVRAAIKIARQFPDEFHLIIDGECNSSCANYFVPLAEQLTFESGAMIVLHGSADKGLADIQREQLSETAIAKIEETGRWQSAFARDYNIHPGWLFIRTKADYINSSLGRHVAGMIDTDIAETPSGPIKIKSVIAYEPLIRSCFPNIEINGISDARIQTFKQDTPMRKSLVAQGIVGSGTLRCV